MEQPKQIISSPLFISLENSANFSASELCKKDYEPLVLLFQSLSSRLAVIRQINSPPVQSPAFSNSCFLSGGICVQALNLKHAILTFGFHYPGDNI